MLRHFAFFNANTIRRIDEDGRASDVCPYVREFKGEVAEPPDAGRLIDLAEDERLRVMRAWQDAVSRRHQNEICLDVTSFDYPEGDFCWMVFRPYEQTEPGKMGLLDWPDQHTFVQIDRATARLQTYVTSPRPIRSCCQRIVVDITGTWLAAHHREHGPLYGSFVVEAGGAIFRPDAEMSGLPSMAALKVLEAAAADLDPIDVSTIRQFVPVSPKGAAASCHQSP